MNSFGAADLGPLIADVTHWPDVPAYGQDLPCVLVTADRSSEVRTAAGQLDIAVVNKPLKPAVLRSMMARISALAPAAE